VLLVLKDRGGFAITDRSSMGPDGLYLLFSRGKRPDRYAIRDFVAHRSGVTISFDPAADPPVEPIVDLGEAREQGGETMASARSEQVWIELLHDGLTFDLVGLAPGKGPSFPPVWHRFDLESLPTDTDYEVLHLAPGHHLAGGERLLPVAMGLLALARDLIDYFDELRGVIWPPSMSAIGQQFFESVVTSWLDGGPFPALGLTAFREAPDGALQSEGLEYWINQELRIEPPISTNKIAATRLGVRLVNQLVLVGGIDTVERVVAPDGTRLVMRPSRNGKFIRVWRE